jgi:hypothetical protein
VIFTNHRKGSEMSRFRIITRSLILIVMACLLIIASEPAKAVPSAAVYLDVDTTSDDLSKTACTSAENDCSLRGAVEFVNHAVTGPDYFISIPAGTYSLTLTGDLENDNQTGDLDFLHNKVHLEGTGSSSTILDGQSSDRVLDNRGADLTVEHLKINWGVAPEGDYGGGGVINRGTASMRVDDVMIMNNSVTGSDTSLDVGGGISNIGILSIHNSIIRVNIACYGGGIANLFAALTITDTTIFMNTAQSENSCGRGGGIYSKTGSSLFELSNVLVMGNDAARGAGVYCESVTHGNISDTTIGNNTASAEGGGLVNYANLTLNRVTLSGNQSVSFGGGITNYADLTLVNVTISGNSSLHGGGIYAYGPSSISMNHCTVAENTGTGINLGYAYVDNPGSIFVSHNTILASSNFGGTCILQNSITDLGYNLSSDHSCGFMAGTPYHDLIDTNPALGSLQDNGGLTQTMALLWGSSAVDRADPASMLAKDQRLAFRPINGDVTWGDIVPGAVPDIGAYEYASYPLNFFFWMPSIFVSIYID